MSNRDYANRRPQSGAKPRPVRATRWPKPQSLHNLNQRRVKLPLTLIGFVILAVGCFVYFLWSIKDNAQQEKKQPSQLRPKKTETRVKPQENVVLTLR